MMSSVRSLTGLWWRSTAPLPHFGDHIMMERHNSDSLWAGLVDGVKTSCGSYITGCNGSPGEFRAGYMAFPPPLDADVCNYAFALSASNRQGSCERGKTSNE